MITLTASDVGVATPHLNQGTPHNF